MATTTTKRSGANATRNSSRSSARKRSQAAKRAAATRAARNSGARGLAHRGADLARKGKTPIVAGAAAVAGFAGGAALRRTNGRKVLGKRIPPIRMPHVRKGPSAGKALASTASEIGKAGYKLGQLTSEVRKVREQVEK